MPIDINSLRTYKGGDPDAYRLYMTQRYKDPTLGAFGRADVPCRSVPVENSIFCEGYGICGCGGLFVIFEGWIKGKIIA